MSERTDECTIVGLLTGFDHDKIAELGGICGCGCRTVYTAQEFLDMLDEM